MKSSPITSDDVLAIPNSLGGVRRVDGCLNAVEDNNRTDRDGRRRNARGDEDTHVLGFLAARRNVVIAVLYTAYIARPELCKSAGQLLTLDTSRFASSRTTGAVASGYDLAAVDGIDAAPDACEACAIETARDMTYAQALERLNIDREFMLISFAVKVAPTATATHGPLLRPSLRASAHWSPCRCWKRIRQSASS
jgi:hypothetical protein